MRIPTVHLNGTSGPELLGQVTWASLAVDHAIDKLQAAWPNGRDYYVQDDEAMSECLEEWNARMAKLVEVKKELDQIAEGIGKQLEEQGVAPWVPR